MRGLLQCGFDARSHVRSCVCRMVIQGSGFSEDRYTGSNVVFIGTYPCTVINHLTSDSVASNFRARAYFGGMAP